MHAEKKLPFVLKNTILLHIPLLALTDGQSYRRRNKLIPVGLGNLRFLQVKSPLLATESIVSSIVLEDET